MHKGNGIVFLQRMFHQWYKRNRLEHGLLCSPQLHSWMIFSQLEKHRWWPMLKPKSSHLLPTATPLQKLQHYTPHTPQSFWRPQVDTRII